MFDQLTELVKQFGGDAVVTIQPYQMNITKP